ncbi:MAG: VCBS repeat-containing protein, partial [Pricia sp.]|nr:VCBS repeat-containing protein [Pricia sp.]
ILYGDEKKSYGENFVSRGFQSSVQHGLHFGVGDNQKIDSLKITWPDGENSVLTNLSTNKTYTLQPPEERDTILTRSGSVSEKWLKEIYPLFNFQHKENGYLDFNNERLLTQVYSNEGPAFAIKDINDDGRMDFFLGGAKNQSGSLFISSSNGYREESTPFENEIGSEDTDAVFFDGDNDGDIDLYVCHGGRAFSPYSTALNDTYYSNENGSFIKKEIQPAFPIAISSSVAKPSDYDNDGDLDLFVGERYKTHIYGLPESGYLLENDGKGNFKTVESKTLADIGMITDAAWSDLNDDGSQDLIIVGEWMDIRVFLNQKGTFTEATASFGLDNTSGLWNALEIADLDNDGDEDFIVGNHGLNTFFETEMRMYIADFDGNGFQEQLICKHKDGKYYPIVEKDELVAQIPSLKKKLLYYKDYAQADMHSIFSEEIIKNTPYFDLNILETTAFLNENGKFIPMKLPSELQYAPIYAIAASDIDEDGHIDLFFGGNQYFVKPQFGRYDASMGWAIFGPFLNHQKAEVMALGIKGQIRSLRWIDQGNEKILVAPINDEKTKFYVFKN